MRLKRTRHSRDEPAADATPPRSRRRAGPRHPMNFTLAGLPELELFESAADREAAMAELSREAANLRSIWYWIAVLSLAAAAFVTLRVSQAVLSRLGAPPAFAEIGAFVPTFVVFFLVLRWWHRVGVQRDLRVKLLARGVPVCLGCGYSLRGHTPEAERCPECGRPLDEQTRRVLKTCSPEPPDEDGD